MNSHILFYVSGKPEGKDRPRFSRFGHCYSTAKTQQYERRVRLSAIDAINKWQNRTGREWDKDSFFLVSVDARFPIPKSWSKKKREQALRGEIKPGKPDGDNIIKAVLDGLNGVAFSDDSRVSRHYCDKDWAVGEPFDAPEWLDEGAGYIAVHVADLVGKR